MDLQLVGDLELHLETVVVWQGPMTDDLKTLCLTSLRTVIQTFATVKQSTITVRYCVTAFLLIIIIIIIHPFYAAIRS